MKRMLRSCAMLLFLLSHTLSLHAQRGGEASLDVEVGDVYDFETVKQTLIESKDPLTDSLRAVSKEVVALSTLEVSEVADETITWKMSMAVSQTAGDEEMNSLFGGGAIPIEVNMITDRRGKVKEMNMGSEENGLPGTELMSAIVNGSGGEHEEAGGMFIPHTLVKRKVGEEWSSTSFDTTALTIMAGMSLDIISRTSMTFTYEGTIDTLDVSAARLRWTVDTMELSGSFAVPGTEMTISIDGGGTGSGLAYYSLNDGILLSKTDDMPILQNVHMGAMGSQSMTMITHSEQGRPD